MFELVESYIYDWGPLLTTPWIALATVGLFARRFQGLLTRLFFVVLLVLWYKYLSLQGHHQLFSILVSELLRWKDPKDILGKHYTMNIAEILITQAIAEIVILVLPNPLWPTIFTSTCLTLIFHWSNVSQLWMQKLVSGLSWWNRTIWQYAGLLVESPFLFIGAYADTPATRAVVYGIRDLWYRFTIQVRPLLDVFSLSVLILYFMDRSNPVYGALLRVLRVLMPYHLFFRNIGKFANPNPPKYKYTPLRKSEDIRVILLYPRFLFLPICCSLLQGPQMGLLFYEAISYTWGGMAATEDILVDGCTMKVTKSVYEILATCSSLFMPKLLWIDALCIDQENESEKTNQVKLMRKIYGNSEFCTVFLGQSPLNQKVVSEKIPSPFRFRYDVLKTRDGSTRTHFEEARLAFSLLSEFNILDEVFRQASMNRIYESYENASPTTRKAWSALLKMLRHPWFERIWVVQEVALPERVQVRYGDEVIDWDILAEGMEMLHRSRSVMLWLEWHHRVGIRPEEFNSLYNVSRIDLFRKRSKVDKYTLFERGATLPELLAKSFYFKASDDKDLIYGLLGICRDKVSVDYGADVEEVYLNAAKAMYDRGAVGQLFYSAGAKDGLTTDPRTLRLPSWVPDWTNAPKYTQLEGFMAGGRVISDLKVNLKNDRVLTLTGFCVDSIDGIGPVFRSATDQLGEWKLEEMYQLATGYEKCWSHMRDSSQSKDPDPHITETQSLREAFHRTMLTNEVWADRWNRSSTEVLDRFPEWEEDLKTFLVPDRTAPDSNERDVIYQRLQRMDTTTERVKASWSGRRTLISTKGYIGLCPPHTEQGDVVIVAPGLATPVVLRRILKDKQQSRSRDGVVRKYQLIGQCYVHGIMNGEALSMGIPKEKMDII